MKESARQVGRDGRAAIGHRQHFLGKTAKPTVFDQISRGAQLERYQGVLLVFHGQLWLGIAEPARHAVDEFIEFGGLVKKRMGAGRHADFPHVLGRIVGQYDYLLRRQGAQALDKVNAVALGKPQIDHLRRIPVVPTPVDPLAGVELSRRRAHHPGLGQLLQRLGEPFESDRVVLNEVNSGWHPRQGWCTAKFDKARRWLACAPDIAAVLDCILLNLGFAMVRRLGYYVATPAGPAKPGLKAPKH